MSPAVGLIAAALLVLVNAFFVAVEFALVAVDRTKVQLEAEQGDRKAVIVQKLLSSLSFQLSGAQLGITISSILLGYLAEPSIAALLEPVLGGVVGDDRSAGISVLIALLLATTVQMLLGELIPKSVAVGNPLFVARLLGRPMAIFSAVTRPLTSIFNVSSDALLRLGGLEPTEELAQVRNRPELMRLLSRSLEEGTLQTSEVALLTKVFRFQEKTVADVQQPRPDVVSIESTATVADLVALSDSTGFSRFPVTDGDLDNIIGVTHVKSVFAIPFEERSGASVSDLMVAPTVVPESADVADLMLEMRSGSTQLVVALDEYGGTSGILTLEDLLEEIVGEIDDEHDNVSAPAPVMKVGKEWVLAGRLHPDEVFDACGLILPEGHFETLAGFVLDRLGKIPVVGERCEYEGWTIDVKEMDRRRVASVGIRAPETLAAEHTQNGDDRSRDGGNRS